MSESRINEERAHPPASERPADKPNDPNFEMVTPLPKVDQAGQTQRRSDGRPRCLSNPLNVAVPEMTFPRRKVLPIRPLKSALTAMLASSGASSNPFAESYAAISGRAETTSMNVQVYFPHTIEPAGRVMSLSVRKDATVEEVIGFALWSYWEAGWLPKLTDGLTGDTDPKWGTKLSAVGWIMRIAEDDGEVDDEFPRGFVCSTSLRKLISLEAPDRTGKISKFSFDAYAVLEASPSQSRLLTKMNHTAIDQVVISVQQNKILESKIQRRPSRTTLAKKVERSVPVGLPVPAAAPGTSGSIGSTLGSVPLSISLGRSPSHGPQIFLRIRVADTADAVHISTTIPVYVLSLPFKDL